MADIVFIFHDFWGCKRGNEYVYPPFYDAWINELKNNGNNVYCYIRPIVQKRFDFSTKIDSELLKELQQINPDLFIIVNNQFWDITDHFDCPILLYGVDSPIFFNKSNLTSKNTDRFKFVVQQACEIELVKEMYKVKNDAVDLIFPVTSIKNTNAQKDKYITFVGSQWIWEGLASLVDYMKRKPTVEDSIFAKRIHYEMINNISGLKYKEILDKLYKENPNYPKAKLIIENDDLYIGRMSGIRRARYLANLADLGLEIYGNFWATPCMAYFPELALSHIAKNIVSKNEIEDLYNRSLISFQLNHIQAKSGFSWKIPDVMASGSVLATCATEDFNKLFGKNIPTFESEAEARELCEKLLNNPNMREDIVLYSNQKVDELFRPSNALKQLENLSGVKLVNSSESAGNVKVKMFDLQTTDTEQNIKNNVIVSHKQLRGFKKIRYKIWHHLNKEFKQ